jgi:hypothetical protein
MMMIYCQQKKVFSIARDTLFRILLPKYTMADKPKKVIPKIKKKFSGFLSDE